MSFRVFSSTTLYKQNNYVRIVLLTESSFGDATQDLGEDLQILYINYKNLIIKYSKSTLFNTQIKILL